MVFSSLKLNTTPSIPRAVTRKHSSFKTQASSLRFERSTPKIILNGGSNISRRDALSCVTSTLLFTALIQTEPADAARITRPDMRRTLMEKLEQLREKAGLKKKENTAPKEEKIIPKLEKKEQPKEEKKIPKLEKNEKKEQPKEEKNEKKEQPKEEKNEKKEQPKEEKKEPSSDSKEQPKLVEASF